ncbi:hypothetical protein HGA13_02320 [Nocardia speluncae]|uniref:HD domain-containing protein n=1 Tax=Nocardia speluncae TaxID=419477 RepID=A0A846XB93_9NOCA|nr:hypothetical protein [Nocardia speluncae]NKY31913.1 hypothetical protein [Nocardia speluncae]
MTILEPERVDRTLARYATSLGPSAPVYRNHVLRGLNYHALLFRRALPASAVLAWTVHDLGLWTAGTFDYLAPSADLVDELAADFGVVDTGEAKLMVLDHHKLRAADNRLVETFRRADLIDVGRGLVRFGIARTQMHGIVRAFPYLGFHRWLAAGLARHAIRHPTAPAPMVRW